MTEMTAAELEKREHIRERAHEIWIERGRLHGRDVEHWLAAERELDEEGPRSQHSRPAGPTDCAARLCS